MGFESNEIVSIRRATVADVRAVQSCAHAAYVKYIDRMGQKPAPMIADFYGQTVDGHVYVACSGSSFAGFVVFYQKQDHLHLENVAVLPDHSGQGIGRLLIEYVEHAAREKGLSAVELYTNEAMTENLSMYPKLGYVEIGRKQQAGFNRVFFRKAV